jgi:glucokinase
LSGTVGFDLGGTNIKAAAFAPDGTLIGRWTRATRDAQGEGTPAFAATVRALLSEIDPSPDHVGLAAPGLTAKDGRCIASVRGKMRGLEGLDWTAFLEREEIVPVLNDAHAALLGEVWRGAARNCRDAILLTLGTGVGGAILADGRLLKGTIGRAGHLGHISVSDSAERSIFGTPGALELAIGDSTVAGRSGGRFSSTRQLVEAHRSGDVDATAVWLTSIRVLARAIASLINILDPERIIVGGGIANAGPDLFEPLAVALDDVEWRPADHRVRIVPAQLGEWAGAYGAAFNAMKPSAALLSDAVNRDLQPLSEST